jgi:Flp pilus assembly protein TadG
MQAKTHRQHRGTSIIEFALVVPVLLAVMIAILEAAWLARTHLNIANATREGARSASLGRPVATIRTRVINAAYPITVSSANVALTYSTDNGATYPYTLGDSGTQNNASGGSLVRVTVTQPHRSLTGFFPFMRNRTVTMRVTMRRETS